MPSHGTGGYPITNTRPENGKADGLNKGDNTDITRLFSFMGIKITASCKSNMIRPMSRMEEGFRGISNDNITKPNPMAAITSKSSV